MKGRESGMPDESMWDTFFDAPEILAKLEFDSSVRTAIEFGSGYGTFSIPASQIVSEQLVALDIEAPLIETLVQHANELRFPIQAICRDFVANGTGLANESSDYAMLFNILHIEDPVSLLKEAARVLKDAGKVGVIHWNYDDATPRGPSMDIRPKPKDCINWARDAGLTLVKQVDLPPYHYGLVFKKNKGK